MADNLDETDETPEHQNSTTKICRKSNNPLGQFFHDKCIVKENKSFYVWKICNSEVQLWNNGTKKTLESVYFISPWHPIFYMETARVTRVQIKVRLCSNRKTSPIQVVLSLIFQASRSLIYYSQIQSSFFHLEKLIFSYMKTGLKKGVVSGVGCCRFGCRFGCRFLSVWQLIWRFAFLFFTIYFRFSLLYSFHIFNGN